MSLTKVWEKLSVFFAKTVPQFFKNNFKISYSKRSKNVGMLLFAIAFAFVLFSIGQFIKLDFSQKWLLLAVALVAPVVLGFFAAYSIEIKHNVISTIVHFLTLLVVVPLVTVTMTECLNGVFIVDMNPLAFFGNYMVVTVFLLLLYGVLGSIKWACLILEPVLFGLSLAQCYLLDFRGTPFLPMDFFSIGTAMGVANTYDYTPTYKIVLASFLFIFIIILAIKSKMPKFSVLFKTVSRCITSTFSIVILVLYFCTSIFTNLGVRPNFWNQPWGYRNYGFALNFFMNTRYIYMAAPNDYNSGDVGGQIDKVVENKPEVDNSYRKPNIICIMNESLSDLGVLGEFETNEDYMPFLRSLSKNTVKGNLYVPVIGAGTSNTEFEFLTGHTTAFLPSGSNAYMLYVKNPIATLVSTLEAQGYSSHAFHPYYADGWDRTEVYSNFGFNKFTSLEDIMDVSLMDEFKANGSDPNYLQQLMDLHYPNENMLVRQYVSDEYNYDYIIEDFKKRDKSVPYFMFNVTMQNHGGYTNSCVNFEENIYTTSLSKNYTKTDKYLSLMKYSDDAFKGLIEYFSKVKEPTVICMFGDHQPSIEQDFVSEVMGVSDLNALTIEQEQQRHCTPFYIWANFKIEEKEYDKLSSNYLSSLVLQTAGVKLTEYNKYLLKLSETLPVIDTVGYIDSEGTHYAWNETSAYNEILSDYERIQYNNIFDQQNVDSTKFYINGFIPEKTEPEPETESEAQE